MLELTPQKILDALSVGVQLMAIDGTIIYSNQAARQLLGGDERSRAEFTGQMIDEQGEPINLADLPSAQALATREVVEGTIGVVKDDSVTWLQVFAVPASHNGIQVGVVVSLVDITTQVEADRIHGEFQEQKRNLTRILPHEWRTPIAIALGWLDMLIGGYVGTLTSEQLTAAIKARGGARRLQVVVNRLTAVMEPLNMSVFDLLKPISEVLAADELWAWTRRKPGDVSIEVGGKSLPIASDYTKVKTAIFELINNAIKFTPLEGGEIEVEMGQDGAYVTVSVTDNGIGIDPSEHEKIYGYFYQVDSTDVRPYEGSGIGLAIVQELMEWLGGRVELRSELGEGATFVLMLPVYDNEDG